MEPQNASPSRDSVDLDDPVFTMEDAPSTDLYGLSGLQSLISPGLPLPFGNTNAMHLKYKANLVGEKILNPAIYLCDQCSLPILIYGRMVCFSYMTIWGCWMPEVIQMVSPPF